MNLTNITPFVRGLNRIEQTAIDVEAFAKEAQINQPVDHRDWLIAQIKKCTSDGPEMSSLFREFTYVKKQINVLRGVK